MTGTDDDEGGQVAAMTMNARTMANGNDSSTMRHG
jgi:hypothetical protein